MSEETMTSEAGKRDKLGRVARPLVQSKSLTIRLSPDELDALEKFRALREEASGGGRVTLSTAAREALMSGVGERSGALREALSAGAFDADARALLERVYDALGHAEGVVRKVGTNELQVLRKVNGGDSLSSSMVAAIEVNRGELHAITELMGEIAEAVSSIGGGGN